MNKRILFCCERLLIDFAIKGVHFCFSVSEMCNRVNLRCCAREVRLLATYCARTCKKLAFWRDRFFFCFLTLACMRACGIIIFIDSLICGVRTYNKVHRLLLRTHARTKTHHRTINNLHVRFFSWWWWCWSFLVGENSRGLAGPVRSDTILIVNNEMSFTVSRVISFGSLRERGKRWWCVVGRCMD